MMQKLLESTVRSSGPLGSQILRGARPKGLMPCLLLRTLKKKNVTVSQLHLSSVPLLNPTLTSSPFFCAGGGSGPRRAPPTIACTLHHMGPSQPEPLETRRTSVPPPTGGKQPGSAQVTAAPELRRSSQASSLRSPWPAFSPSATLNKQSPTPAHSGPRPQPAQHQGAGSAPGRDQQAARAEPGPPPAPGPWGAGRSAPVRSGGGAGEHARVCARDAAPPACAAAAGRRRGRTSANLVCVPTPPPARGCTRKCGAHTRSGAAHAGSAARPQLRGPALARERRRRQAASGPAFPCGDAVPGSRIPMRPLGLVYTLVCANFCSYRGASAAPQSASIRALRNANLRRDGETCRFYFL